MNNPSKKYIDGLLSFYYSHLVMLNNDTPNEKNIGQVWYDMKNNEPIQLEHNFPCTGMTGYNGNFSNDVSEVLRFDQLRKASGEEVMQWRMIRREWKEEKRDDS